MKKYLSKLMILSAVFGCLCLSLGTNNMAFAEFDTRTHKDVGITGEIGDEAKNLNSQAMNFDVEEQKHQKQRQQRRTLFKVYENRYVWLFSTFVPTVDARDKPATANLNFVSATHILRKEDASLLCLKVTKIKDLSLEYLSAHPIHLDSNGEFDSIKVAANVAKYLSERLGFKVLRYMIVFEGIYSKIKKDTKIHGFLPKNLIIRCSELKGKLNKDKKED